jgi:hypothetical protein
VVKDLKISLNLRKMGQFILKLSCANHVLQPARYKFAATHDQTAEINALAPIYL